MKMIDANIALRYLLDDHETLSQQASDILENNQVFLTFEVFCEIVYVLEKVYQVPRDEIQSTINKLLDSQQLDTNNPAILKSALELYRNRNIDIVDAILCSYSRLDHVEIFTFDNKLIKCLKSTK